MKSHYEYGIPRDVNQEVKLVLAACKSKNELLNAINELCADIDAYGEMLNSANTSELKRILKNILDELVQTRKRLDYVNESLVDKTLMDE